MVPKKSRFVFRGPRLLGYWKARLWYYIQSKFVKWGEFIKTYLAGLSFLFCLGECQNRWHGFSRWYHSGTRNLPGNWGNFSLDNINRNSFFIVTLVAFVTTNWWFCPSPVRFVVSVCVGFEIRMQLSWLRTVSLLREQRTWIAFQLWRSYL